MKDGLPKPPPESPPGPVKRRAMSDTAKQHRRQAILDAALLALVDTPFEQLTVAQLAERLGLAKGTLYLYFSTKEALFLEVQQQQLALWFDELESALGSERPATLAPEQLAELICGTIFKCPLMPRLLTVLHTVLERNITLDQALAFKLFLLERFRRAAALLEAALPALGPRAEGASGQGFSLLLALHALVVGSWQMTNYSAAVEAALATRADLGVFFFSFEKVLGEALRALITGMAVGQPGGAEAAVAPSPSR